MAEQNHWERTEIVKNLGVIENLANEISDNDKSDIVIALKAENIKEQVQDIRKILNYMEG